MNSVIELTKKYEKVIGLMEEELGRIKPENLGCSVLLAQISVYRAVVLDLIAIEKNKWVNSGLG